MKFSLNERDIKTMLFNYLKGLVPNLTEDDIEFSFDNYSEKYLNISINKDKQIHKNFATLQDLIDKTTYQEAENEKERREKINELREKLRKSFDKEKR